MAGPALPENVPASDHDPFEAFNRSQGVGSVRDPHTSWAEWRRRAPVVPISVEDLIGRSPMSSFLPGPIFMAVSYDAVSAILRDGTTFSSSIYGRTMGLVMGRTILEMDEPEHSRYRGLLRTAFSRRTLERWERELVRPVVERHIDCFVERGRADLVRELTFPFPVTVIAGMIGLPEQERDAFHRLAVELISIAFDPARGVAASRALGEMFGRLVAERRGAPRDDLASLLAGAELEGTRLGDEEIFAFLRLLAPAGAETTYRSTSNLLVGLLSSPEQLEAVRRDRRLVPQAIEEGLRWEPPLTTILRTAARDADVCGVAIPEGAVVCVNVAAANRDPARWEAPDVFDLFRPPRPHLAFAFGPHRCLGMHLARIESQVLLETVLDRLPGLRFDPDADEVFVTGRMFRSPLALPVCFDPPRRSAS
jgi:cytochrome P450